MEIHEKAKELYREGYRSAGGGANYLLSDPSGKKLSYFYGDSDKPIEGHPYTDDELEMRLRPAGTVEGFIQPTCQLTDWLLTQMQMFGLTTDGFLCDLARTSDASAKLVKIAREYIAQEGEKFAAAFFEEPLGLGLLLPIKLIGVVTPSDKLSGDEFSQALADLIKLAAQRHIGPLPAST